MKRAARPRWYTEGPSCRLPTLGRCGAWHCTCVRRWRDLSAQEHLQEPQKRARCGRPGYGPSEWTWSPASSLSGRCPGNRQFQICHLKWWHSGTWRRGAYRSRFQPPGYRTDLSWSYLQRDRTCCSEWIRHCGSQRWGFSDPATKRWCAPTLRRLVLLPATSSLGLRSEVSLVALRRRRPSPRQPHIGSYRSWRRRPSTTEKAEGWANRDMFALQGLWHSRWSPWTWALLSSWASRWGGDQPRGWRVAYGSSGWKWLCWNLSHDLHTDS